jgi:hypothetical protein
MSLKVGTAEPFGPGPHQLVVGAMERVAIESAFPGLVGRRLLNLREDTYKAAQSGLLVASGASISQAHTALEAIYTAIDALVLDAAHTLTDGFGKTWSNLVMTAWRPTGPRRVSEKGGSWTISQPYEADWVQVMA